MKTIPEYEYKELVRIGAAINSQKCYGFQHPIFIVQRRERIFGAENAEENWFNIENDMEEASEEKAAQLDSDDQWQLKEEDWCWTKLRYTDVWHIQEVFFTEEAANQYVATLISKNPSLQDLYHVSVDCCAKNEEMKFLRNFLISLASP